MRNKITLLVILILSSILMFYFVPPMRCFLVSRCLSPFKYAKNLYVISSSIDKDYFNNGDWYEFYRGQLYSNYDYQRNPELHGRVLKYREDSDADMIINPNRIVIGIKEKYKCGGKDRDFCSNLITNKLQEIKDAGFLKLSDKDIENIGQVAEENSIIAKVGFFQLGPVKIPPMKWVSYSDSECDVEPDIVFFGRIVLFSDQFVGCLSLIFIIVVLLIILLLAIHIKKKAKE